MAKEKIKMNKLFKFGIVFLMLLIVSSFASAIDTIDNQAWLTLQDGNVSSFDIYGGVTGAEGVLNGAYDFDGVNDYVNTGFSPIYTSDFSFSGWFYKEGAGSGVATWLGTRDATNPFIHIYESGGNMVLNMRDTSSNSISETTTGITINTGEFYFLTMTFETITKTARLYVNGVERASGSNVAFNGDYGGDVIFGRNGFSSEHYLNGKIDETKVFNKTLSESEILELYNSGSPIEKEVAGTTQTFYASFDSLYDQSNNSNDASAYNGVTYDATTNAFDFDGVNDYLSVSGFGNPTTYTISTWFNTDSIGVNQWLVGGSGGANYPDIIVLNTGSLLFRGSSTEGGVSTTSTVTTGSWNHVVITGEGVNRKIYLNGVLEDNDNMAGNTVFQNVLEIGRRGDATGYFDGKISSVSVFNRSLSSTEISDLYAEGRDYNPYTSVVSNFTITAVDFNSENVIYNFTAEINGTNYTSEIVTGQIVTPYLKNESVLVDINIFANEYETGTYLNYDISNDLQALLNRTVYEFVLYGRTIVTDSIVNNWKINNSDYEFNTTNGTIIGELPKMVYTFNITNEEFYYNFSNQLINITGNNDIYTYFFYDTIVNVTTRNVYDNSSFTNFTLNLSYPSSGYENVTQNNIDDTNTYYLEQDLNYTLDLATELFYDQTYTVNPNASTYTYYANTYQSILNLTLKAIKAEIIVPSANYTFNNSGYITTYNFTDQNNHLFYLNASNYSITIQNNEYDTKQINQTTTVKSKVDRTVYLSYLALFNLFDERTGDTFDIYSTSRAQFILICEDQTYFTLINSTSFNVPIVCDYRKFTFSLEYDYLAESYSRSLILEPDDFFNVDVYLLDLNTTEEVLVKFVIDDLYNAYENLSIFVFSYIEDQEVQITSDNVDFDNSIAAYLMLNQQYTLVVTSDNQPPFLPGTYTANYPEIKYIRVYEVDPGANPEEKIIANGFTYTYNGTNDTYIGAYYEDPNNTTGYIKFSIYENRVSSETLIDTVQYSSNNATADFNISAYENSTVLLKIESTVFDTYEEPWTKIIYENNVANIEARNSTFFTEILTGLLMVIFAVFSIYLNKDNSNLGAIILCAFGGFMVMLQIFEVGWSAIALAGVISLIEFFLSGAGGK